MFQFPLNKTVITSRFIIYNTLGRSMHYGMDYACSVGTPIYAANSGTIFMSTYDSAGGNMIGILGEYELSRYAHLSERYVKVGDTVSRGQLIGYTGNTGSATTGPHLHFETWLVPLKYKYNYADRTKYAVDPMCVCHLVEGQEFNNNGLSTCKPIPYPEPSVTSMQGISGTVTIKKGDSVRIRMIPESLGDYQYLVGGYNRSYDVASELLSGTSYNTTYIADNTGYKWALINTERGQCWVAIIKGVTEVSYSLGELITITDPDKDASEKVIGTSSQLASLKSQLASAEATIKKNNEVFSQIKTLIDSSK